MALRQVQPETSGIGKYSQCLATGMLFPQLTGTRGCKVGNRFFQDSQLADPISKATACTDTFLLRQIVYINTRNTLQLFPGTHTGHRKLFPDPRFRLGTEVGCRMNSVISQLLPHPPPDTPDIFNREILQGFLPFLFRINQTYAFITGILFPVFRCDFRQRLCGGNAQGNRDSSSFGYCPYQL